MTQLEFADSLFRSIPKYEGFYTRHYNINHLSFIYYEGDDCYLDWHETGKDLEHPELMELFDWLEANAITIEWSCWAIDYYFENFDVTIFFGEY